VSRGDKLVLLAAGLVYLPFITLGYGSDSDTYGVLAAGRHFLATGAYMPSRNPGYPVFELLTLLLDQIGGFRLTNLGSLLMALWAGWSIQRICNACRIPHGTVLSGILFLHPYFFIHATSTHDHIWSLALLLGGLERICRGKIKTAILLLGLAIGTRFTSAAGLVGVLLIMKATGHSWSAIRRVGLGGLLIGLLWYLLPFGYSGWNLDFMRPGLGDDSYWTPMLKLGKFGYKHLRFWGLPALALLVWFSVRILSGRASEIHQDRRSLVKALVLTIGLYEILFLVFPVEPAYLLPVLPFTLLLIGLADLRWRFQALLAVCLVFSAFLQIELARPDVPRYSRSADLGFWMHSGIVLQDIGLRTTLQDCPDAECIHETLKAHKTASPRY
jgi:hypothetical protein